MNLNGVSACPIRDSHQRFEDAHLFWHEALNCYSTPKEFRRRLNSCLQEMRNFTFILQKELKRNPTFEAWYEVWQDRLKQDSTMQWLNTSRVNVVHKKDLTLHSSAEVRVVATYDDAAEAVSRGISGEANGTNRSKQQTERGFFTDPENTTREIIGEIVNRDLPKSVLEQATVTIERIWRESTLPNSEVLTVLSNCFGVYWELMKEAHELLHADIDVCSVAKANDHSIQVTKFGDSFRPRCMMTSRKERTRTVRLRDGVMLSGAVEIEVPLPDEVGNSTRRRSGELAEVEIEDPSDIFSMIPYYVAEAKKILESKRQHDWLVFLFRGRSVQVLQLEAEDSADKRGLIQMVAEHCARDACDGIIFVGEAWHSPISFAEDGVPMAAVQHPERVERILIHAETSDGRSETVMVPIIRRPFRKPTFGPVETSHAEANFMAPVRAVWKESQT